MTSEAYSDVHIAIVQHLKLLCNDVDDLIVSLHLDCSVIDELMKYKSLASQLMLTDEITLDIIKKNRLSINIKKAIHYENYIMHNNPQVSIIIVMSMMIHNFGEYIKTFNQIVSKEHELQEDWTRQCRENFKIIHRDFLSQTPCTELFTETLATLCNSLAKGPTISDTIVIVPITLNITDFVNDGDFEKFKLDKPLLKYHELVHLAVLSFIKALYHINNNIIYLQKLHNSDNFKLYLDYVHFFVLTNKISEVKNYEDLKNKMGDIVIPEPSVIDEKLDINAITMKQNNVGIY